MVREVHRGRREICEDAVARAFFVGGLPLVEEVLPAAHMPQAGQLLRVSLPARDCPNDHHYHPSLAPLGRSPLASRPLTTARNTRCSRLTRSIPPGCGRRDYDTTSLRLRERDRRQDARPRNPARVSSNCFNSSWCSSNRCRQTNTPCSCNACWRRRHPRR